MVSEMLQSVEWSRAQFALTAIYHWLFVPLTLGLSVLCALMETRYVRTGDEVWRKHAKFWGKLFIINFTLSCVVRAMQNRRKKALVFAPAKAA